MEICNTIDGNATELTGTVLNTLAIALNHTKSSSKALDLYLQAE
jgi:hypothetical protein